MAYNRIIFERHFVGKMRDIENPLNYLVQGVFTNKDALAALRLRIVLLPSSN